MTSTCARGATPATEISTGFSQLRLPFLRVEGRKGLLLPNSPMADGLRRSVVKRLPYGAPEKIAGRLGKRVAQVYDAHAGETTYSVDVFVAALLELRPEEARLCLNRVARLVGAWVIPSADADVEEDAA